MPLTKQDVLDTLSSYFVSRMDFWVDKVHVSAANYGKVRQLIEDDDIQVVPGTNPSNAFYHADSNILETQAVDPPPDFQARGLLLHECTHALIDVEKLSITELGDEVACYLAQHTFALLVNPSFVVSPNNPPWFAFFQDVVAMVKKFKLHQPEGRGAHLEYSDYAFLRTELNRLNIYQYLKDRDRAYADGVPVKPRAWSQRTAHEPYPEASDEYLVELLQRRYAANDVAGFGGRVRNLEKMFREMDRLRAKSLLARLQVRQTGDKMSVAFHDHLSTPTRTSLLGILRTR